MGINQTGQTGEFCLETLDGGMLSFELRFWPGSSAKMSGHPDTWEPADPTEVDIEGIYLENAEATDPSDSWMKMSVAQAVEMLGLDGEDELMERLDEVVMDELVRAEEARQEGRWY